MEVGTVISLVAVSISLVTFIINIFAASTKAKKDYVDTLKVTVTNHEQRILHLETLLKSCEAEREVLRKEHYSSLRKIEDLELKLRAC